MNIIDALKQYKQVAINLNDMANAALMEETIERIERKEFLLPFVGQFSAGKSKLINRIIGKDLLPTKTVETTAFLTYIAYSEKESATIEYVDGSKHNIDISEIKKLDHQQTSSEKPIAALRYYAPIGLLKSGLVIVDTPGVNTLVNEHVKVTESLLQGSQYIVYVLRSSPSLYDTAMINRIHNVGIDMLFVRTHVDTMNSDEEDAFVTISKEKDDLEKLVGHEILYYAMCNDQNNSEYQKWSYQFDTFKEYLLTGIAENVDKVYEVATLQRLATIKSKYVEILTTKLETLNKNADKSAEEVSANINELSRKKQIFLDGLSKDENEMHNEAQKCKQRIKDDIAITEKKVEGEFGAILERISEQNGNLNKLAEECFLDKFNDGLSQLNHCAETVLGKFKTVVLQRAQKNVHTISVELDNLDISFNPKFDEEELVYMGIQETAVIEDLVEKYQQTKELLKLSESELEKYGIEKEKISGILEQYDQVIAQGNDKVQTALAGYEPHLIEQGGKVGKILKRVGQVGDIAMLLIPAVGWEKAGTMLAAKAGQLAKSGSVLARTGAKALTDLSKTAMMMAKGTDTVLDAAKLTKYLKDGSKTPLQMMYGEKDKTGILDYLSLAYWFEKAGDMIDPVTYVEDPIYREEYNKMVRQLQNQVDMQVRQKVQILKRNQQLNDAEEIKQIELKVRKEEESKMKGDLEEARTKMDIQIEKNRRKQIVDGTLSQFKSQILEYTRKLVSRCDEEIERIVYEVSDAVKSHVTFQIDEIESQLVDINRRKNDTSFSVKQENEALEMLLKSLEVADGK